MIKILSGEMAIELHLQFLIRNNNTDLMILKNTKVGIHSHAAELLNFRCCASETKAVILVYFLYFCSF